MYPERVLAARLESIICWHRSAQQEKVLIVTSSFIPVSLIPAQGDGLDVHLDAVRDHSRCLGSEPTLVGSYNNSLSALD